VKWKKEEKILATHTHKIRSRQFYLHHQLPQYYLPSNIKMVATAGENQCEVVLVGCGAPKRGMGWYHAVQMIKNKCPSAKLCFIVEPWFMGAGTS
jgi:hypothetical protein